jgi:glycosyltransferase involved in cell wall biosynthesis
MSVCAVMLVKDEADIIGHTVRHLLGQVDYVIVSDNGSTDGTRDVLRAIGGPLQVIDDPEVGYYQDRKTSDLAAHALARGFDWVIPCDADEYWYAPDGRTLAAFLAGLAPDVAFVTADLYNHIPSALDPADEPSPFLRIGWRQREHGALGKVCCRARPGLEIRMGNHSAWAPGTGVTSSGLVIRHYSWRSPEQYLRKIRNGERAYAATGMDPSVGAHWRMFQGATDEAVLEHFRTWFWREDPAADETLIYDPAPGA